MPSKKISIITINLNNADGLRKTIESVESQINDECEYIVIDGKSTDGSVQVIKQYQHCISYWSSNFKKGIYGDMNKGIEKATGEYCLFLNSGDWLNSNILLIALKECTGESIIYFNTYLSYGESRFKEQRYDPQLTMRSFYRKTIGHQSTLIKRELFNIYGQYNEEKRIHSDYEFWIKAIILGNCSYKHVNEFLSFYDMGGLSSRPNKQGLGEVESVLANALPLRVLADYDYWLKQEHELEIVIWYKQQKVLYQVLVFLYKVIKNIKKAFHQKKIPII